MILHKRKLTGLKIQQEINNSSVKQYNRNIMKNLQLQFCSFNVNKKVSEPSNEI
jgi:hypothetical protein